MSRLSSKSDSGLEWDEKVLSGTGKTTLTTKQFNFKYSRGWGTEEELCNTDQANQMRKFCLFSMSKRYAYDKNNNLETRRIAVL